MNFNDLKTYVEFPKICTTLIISLIVLLIRWWASLLKQLWQWLNTPQIIIGLHDTLTIRIDGKPISLNSYYLIIKFPCQLIARKKPDMVVKLILKNKYFQPSDFHINIADFYMPSGYEDSHNLEITEKEDVKQKEITFTAPTHRLLRILVKSDKIFLGQIPATTFNLEITSEDAKIIFKEPNTPYKKFDITKLRGTLN